MAKEKLKLSDFELVDRVFSFVADKQTAHGLDSLVPEERNIYLIWAALGALENGSFQYFFENDMNAEATAQAFDQVGLPDSAECFRLSESLLPSDYVTADHSRKMELLRSHEVSFDSLAMKVLKDGKKTESILASYVSANPRLFAISRT